VPIEGEGQHNPVRGKGFCSVHATEEWRSGDCHVASNPGEDQTTTEEAVVQGQAKTGLPLLGLYGKVYWADILSHAYSLVRANKGAPGIDGVTFASIEDGAWLGQFMRKLAENLESKTYRAQAVRRVWIPKADGSKWPLGIPTIRDRVAQMAVSALLTPLSCLTLTKPVPNPR